MEAFVVTCNDGVTLHGELYIPDQPIGVVQFNNGTATNKKVYRNFLQFLANAGYVCALWDYRDTGASAPVNLRNCDYQYSDYGMQDLPAIKTYLQNRFSGLPFYLIGHSTGGQQVGLMPDLTDINGAINIGVSSGYLGHMPWHYRWQAYAFFYAFVPGSIAINGYVAVKPVGFMENLPSAVALQWRDWCSKKDYFFDNAFRGNSLPSNVYQNIHFPIKVYHANDETISTADNVASFWRHVKSNASLEIKQLSTHECGVKAIGHFGYFSRALKETFWQRVLADLKQMP